MTYCVNLDKKPTLNIDLLRRAVEWARRESVTGAWKQSAWCVGQTTDEVVSVEMEHWDGTVDEVDMRVVCGTAFCIAGHIAADAGDTFVVRGPSGYRPGDETETGRVVPSDGGRVMDVDARAAILLGVSAWQVGRLFDPGNSLDDVMDYAEELAASYGHTL